MNIEEMKEASVRNAPVDGTFIITKIEAKPFKAKAGFFLQCELTDKTGSIKGIVWDHADILKECLKNKQVFKITGEATRYNDNPQIVIKTAVKAETFNPADFMPSLSQDERGAYLKFLREIGATIKGPCRKVWEELLGSEGFDFDNPVSERFLMCPGGVGDVIHHSYLGGLMEHTASMVKIADEFCRFRPHLDREIILTGCLVHDIGKVYTYDWTTVIEMTDSGRLLHHTVLGYDIMNDLFKNSDLCSKDLDPKILLHLQHIVISHHQDEGVRKPMTPEAEAVAQIDSLDASVKGVQQYVEDESNMQEDGNWTRYCSLTGRQYFVPKEEPGPTLPPDTPSKPIVEDSLF